MGTITHVDLVDDGETEVRIVLPNAVMRIIDDLAIRKGITRTEAVVQAVVTTKVLVGIAPNGAVVSAR